MKKLVKSAALVMASVSLLGSCSEGSVTAGQDALINAVVSDAASANKTAPAAAPVTSAGQDSSSPQGGGETSADVDIDLTAMNSTMIYSVIYDMMINADSYYGKSLLVDGYFDTIPGGDPDTRYYFVVVPDAAACCVQGLEFKLDDSKLYPQDYPELTEDIRVKGVLDCYEEAGQLYSYIRAEKLEIKES